MRVSLLSFILVVCTFSYSQPSNNKKNQLFSPIGKTVVEFTSADNTNLRLTKTNELKFVEIKQAMEAEISIFVNPDKKFQKILGIGGAITDASAEVFAKLPLKKQAEFLNAYFSKQNGIGYSIIRTTINSCDFSSGSYTYVKDGDKDLSTFSIQHDKKYRIPLIKKAIATAGGNLTLYASPWSPPAYMKDNNNMLKGGKLLPAYYQTWANYYVKFIDSYQKEGIPVWGLTIQNEPLAVQRWESCIYTAEEERDFLKNYLGPTLKKAGMGDKKITVWDHNRDLISQRANVILDDPEANKYVWGVGFHWYENWSGGEPMFENIARVREMYPNKNLLFTEGCVEGFTTDKLQFWSNGERYGRSMINDFNNGTTGWTDWNVLLDENGGPNHVGNFCCAPIHANTQTGELIYTPSYYFIGHFSKFISQNACRISSVSTRSALITTSFINPDGKVVTVVMNQGYVNVNYNLYVGNNAVNVTILPRAIQTLVY